MIPFDIKANQEACRKQIEKMMEGKSDSGRVFRNEKGKLTWSRTSSDNDHVWDGAAIPQLQDQEKSK